MIISAENIPDKSMVQCDVCIAGAGAAGISFALEFLGSETKICVLEGGDLKPDARAQSLLDFESGDLFMFC